MPGLLLGTHREADNCPALQDLVTQPPNLYNLCALPVPVPVGVGAKMFRHTLGAALNTLCLHPHSTTA